MIRSGRHSAFTLTKRTCCFFLVDDDDQKKKKKRKRKRDEDDHIEDVKDAEAPTKKSKVEGQSRKKSLVCFFEFLLNVHPQFRLCCEQVVSLFCPCVPVNITEEASLETGERTLTKSKFSWEAAIIGALVAADNNTLSIKKLRKKV